MVISVKPFECHITCSPRDAGTVFPIATQHGFTTSLLVGDDAMGDAKLLYCTSHDYTLEMMRRRMGLLVSALEGAGVKTLRRKIEHIVLDERS